MNYNNNQQYNFNNQQYYQGQPQPQYMNNNRGYQQNVGDIERQQMAGFTATKGVQLNYKNQQQNYNKPPNNQQQFDNISELDQMSQNQQGGLTGLSDKDLRRGFIRKVLSIICMQLVITFAFIIPSTLVDGYRDFQMKYRFIAFIAIVLNIGIMITLYCFRKHCMVVPRNYILLFLFTITEGYLVSMLTSVSQPEIVLLSGGITFIIVFFITIYAIKTKNDITQKVTTIFYASIAIIVLILVGSMFRDYIIQTIIGVAIVGLFCFYLVYDIQRLQGGRAQQYSYDDYIIAALDIYINIVVLFQTILGIANRK